MKHTLTPHRRAAAWLFAAAALPFTPLTAQDVPVVNAPPPVITAPPAAAPAPPPISVAPPPRPVTITPAPAPLATPAPAPAETRATRTARTATRTTTVRQRVAAPARQAAPAPAPAPVAAAPEPVPVTTPTTVPEAAPAPLPAEVGADTAPVERQGGIAAIWPWLLAGGVLLIAAIALFARRRRRAEEDVYYDEPVYEETTYEAPVVEAAPEPSFTRAAPVAVAAVAAEREPVADEVAIVDSDAADVEALAAGSEPVAGRPWLEFLMRPLRAGTSRDDAIVQFELTVGNTGSVAARDVRISTWMVAGGQATDMERSLIDPPADANVSELDIAAGDGARVEARMTVPKAGLTEAVMPVVVADARYTLPDGSEGRTHASFTVGMVDGDELAPFPIDRSNLTENVEARLHGEPERV